MRFLILCCLAALALTACDGKKDEKQEQAAQLPPPKVSALTLTRMDVPIYAVFMGQTQGSHSAEVKPQVTGILQKRLFEEGARVKQGDALFQIDPAPFKAALEQARGQLAAAKSKLENARRENARVQKLYKNNAVSQQQRDSALAAFLGARADAESAQAAVDEAVIRLGYTRVDAPLAGYTSREVSTVGSLVSPESTLTFINQSDPMDVRFAVPSVELFAMRDMEARGTAQSYGQGSPASLRLLEGLEYASPGKVVFLDTQVEEATSAVRAKARFPNPAGQLLPGQFVAVRVGGASLTKAILIPQEAVMQTESGPSVYVLDSENRAAIQAVTLGPAFGGHFLVEKGLESGQRIVVEGQDKVSPGRQVEALPHVQSLAEGGTILKTVPLKNTPAVPPLAPLEAPGSASPVFGTGVEAAPAPVSATPGTPQSSPNSGQSVGGPLSPSPASALPSPSPSQEPDSAGGRP